MDLPNQAHILLGIPFNGLVTPEWACSMMLRGEPISVSMTLMPTKNLEVGEARNKIVEEALLLNTRYIWFVDSDTCPPKNAIGALKYIMEQADEDVVAVGGIYCTKTEIPEPLVFRGTNQGAFWRWKVGETFEVDAIGTGCLLIKTDVFRDLPAPWFKTDDVRGETDDMYFCRKVRESGKRILAAGSVICDHLDPEGKVYTLPADSYPMKREKQEMVTV
jgi:GT2 family glycosyltransferase